MSKQQNKPRSQPSLGLAPTNGERKRGRRNLRQMDVTRSNVPQFRVRADRVEVVERTIPGFSMLRYRANLNYTDAFTLSTGAGSAGTYIYSANGCYDPDITSTGHQPMGFDQIMLSFEHYCVVGARMTTNFRNNSTFSPCVSISANAGTTPVTNYTTLVENGTIVRTRLDSTSGFRSMQYLSMPIALARFCSVPDLLDNPDFKGTIASNPAEQAYFHVSTWNLTDVSVQTVAVEIFIEYDVIFFEPRKNGQSLNSKIHRLILQEEREKKTNQ